ncbi:TPA: capsular biosynthesis protein [Burkholderia contaminans]|nr:capsular biosynthesis protein [Burkholderia contaminans]HEM7881606.1 capsular biosynthesis protein [Burkholderia contaminans]
MNDTTTRPSSTPNERLLDPRAFVRGRRLFSLLVGLSPFVWVDHWAGAAVAKITLRLYAAAQPVCPGPVAARHGVRQPTLSWFHIPPNLVGRGGLIAALNQALSAGAHETNDPQARILMQRVLEMDALHVRRRALDLPYEWQTTSGNSRVVLFDERETTQTDVFTPAKERRQRFLEMVQAARLDYPNGEFWLMRSADTGKGGWLSARVSLPSGTRTLNAGHSLRDILVRADIVYVVGASEGMGALLAGVPVQVFGSPYYAGWGLTNDHAEMPERTARPTLDRLFDATFLNFAGYFDPQSHRLGTLESVLDSIELQHAVAARYAELRHVAGVRFQWWKRPFATPFLMSGGGSIRWVSDAGQVRKSEHAAIWGGRPADGLAPSVPHVRIEDGFLHSTGLGSDMSPPYSQVIDHLGIYFDASRPSDLTVILNNAHFTDQELARAAALRLEIIRAGITKYNLGRRKPEWQVPIGKRVVLVAGQVADDASIRLGTSGISTSEALLHEVRINNPDAFIVYKPHPDVLSGNRVGLIDAASLADIVDSDADLLSLIEISDELHTLSSLAGFDALIRGKAVHTYGRPFYAGWGLTIDALPQSWRERKLSLDMLTAGVFLRYAIYWDWQLQLFTTPEAIVRQLAQSAARPLGKIYGNRLRPLLKVMRWSRNALHHVAWRRRQYEKGMRTM